MNNAKVSKLVARLLSSEEIKLVSGGDAPHAQNGNPYTQHGTCPGWYTQMGQAGPYNQSCPPPRPDTHVAE
jgi:hypothetical protein